MTISAVGLIYGHDQNKSDLNCLNVWDHSTALITNKIQKGTLGVMILWLNCSSAILINSSRWMSALPQKLKHSSGCIHLNKRFTWRYKRMSAFSIHSKSYKYISSKMKIKWYAIFKTKKKKTTNQKNRTKTNKTLHPNTKPHLIIPVTDFGNWYHSTQFHTLPIFYYIPEILCRN